MLHSIQSGKHGPLEGPMTHAIEACVHCGFCLAACPTYRELGQEMDSPRGRIVLMKQVLEGTLDWHAAQPHIDRCLGCLACEPACPSGVPYRDLISPFRSLAKTKFNTTLGQKLSRFVAARTVPFPNRFRMAARAGRLVKPFAQLVPGTMRPMLDLLPDTLPRRQKWPQVTLPQGKRRARVGLLLSCAQQALAPDINTATIAVLALNGVEVVVPQTQGCCGGLAWHTGDIEAAQAFARDNLRAFPTDLDAIVSNAAGCGSAMREYHLILKGTPHEADGDAFRKRVVDVSRFLVELGLQTVPRGFGRPVKVAYHDACHLLNAQNVRNEPRVLLGSIPGVEVCEVPHAEICCGSAGTYNLDQPEIAASLGQKKALAIHSTGAQLVATGNIGCLMQVQNHLMKLGSNLRVIHTLQLLRDAYEFRPDENCY